MPNEEIVTALRNSIEHGESLQSAMQIMINSGYNPQEVQEASKFVGQGAITMQKIKPEEQLTMPSKKSFLSKFKTIKKTSPIQTAPSTQQQDKQVKEKIQAQTIPLPVKTTEPLTKQLGKISPPKTKHIKEIILVVILLVLIGILISTLAFKDAILGWFS